MEISQTFKTTAEDACSLQCEVSGARSLSVNMLPKTADNCESDGKLHG